MENIEMKDIFDSASKDIKVGDKIEGEVLEVKDDEILVDVHSFTEGRMYINEYDDSLKTFKGVVKVGDIVTAICKKVDEEHGNIYLSRKPLVEAEKFGSFKDSIYNREVVEVKITKAIPDKGIVGSYKGYSVFVPIEDVAIESDVNLEEYKGRTVKVKLFGFDPVRKEAKGSIKSILKEERYLARKAEFDALEIGNVYEVEVVKLEKFGAFVKFEYNQGLVPASQLSHVPFTDISTILTVGQKINAKLIQKEGNKLTLSVKALLSTPFEDFVAAHKVSDVINGKVVQKLPFGVILEIADHVTGLLHKSEYSWNPNDNLDASLRIGDVVEVAIKSIDTRKEKIGLSRKALLDNPWGRVHANVGDVVKCKITAITPKGIEIEALGVDGLCEGREALPQSAKSKRIEDFYAIGDEVDGKIVEINTREWILLVSFRRLVEAEERKEFEKYMNENTEETNTTIGDVFKDVLK